MPSDSAELAALATAVDEIQRRLAAVTARYEGTTRDDVLGALFEAERQLRAAGREVQRAARLA
jgi:hypothetical protein